MIREKLRKRMKRKNWIEKEYDPLSQRSSLEKEEVMKKEEKPDVILTSLDINPDFPDDFSYIISEKFRKFPFFLFIPSLVKERFTRIIEKIKSEKGVLLDTTNPKLLSHHQFRKVFSHFLQSPKILGDEILIIEVEEDYKRNGNFSRIYSFRRNMSFYYFLQKNIFILFK